MSPGKRFWVNPFSGRASVGTARTFAAERGSEGSPFFGSSPPPVQFILHQGDRVVGVKGDRTEADDESPAVRQEPFLVCEKLLVVRENERRVRGQGGLADVLAAFLQQDERRPEAIERFREGRDRSEDSGRGYSLNPGNVHESAPDQGRVRTNVRLVGFQLEAHETHESRRGRRSEEQQADLGIPAKVVG